MINLEPWTDKGEKLTDITAVVLYLESQGMTEPEIKQWFKTEYPEQKYTVDIYYRGLKAGIKNPFKIAYETLKNLFPNVVV